MKKTIALALLALALVIPSHGATAAAPIYQRYQTSSSIPRAVELYLTTRGQKYFNSNLQEAIYRDGYEFGDGGFEGWSYKAEDAISLEKLPVTLQNHRVTLANLRDVVMHWFKNFNLGDPLIRAELSNINYSVQFHNFGVRVDQEATARTMNGRGIALIFETDVPRVRIDADFVHAHDDNNTELGIFGAEHPWLQTKAKSVPLHIRIPFTIQFNSENNIQAHVQEFVTNLNDVDLDLGFDRPLKLPAVHLTVNGRKMTLNQTKLEETLLVEKQRLLKALQAYLADLTQQKLPTLFTDMLATRYPAPFSDFNRMAPPGESDALAKTHNGHDDTDKYIIGMRPEELKVTPSYIRVGLSAYVDDPKAANQFKPVSRRLTTRLPFELNEDPSTYDVAIAINEDLINRVVGLSYQRGYLSPLSVGDGPDLQILETPEFRFDGTVGPLGGRLHIKASQKMQGFSNQLAIKKQLTFEMDVITRLIHSAGGNAQLAIDHIDLDSVKIDESTVRVPFLGKVRDAVRKKLAAQNASYLRKTKLLVEKIQTPSGIPGVPPLRVRDFKADQNGYMIMFCEYNLEK